MLGDKPKAAVDLPCPEYCTDQLQSNLQFWVDRLRTFSLINLIRNVRQNNFSLITQARVDRQTQSV